MKYLNALRKRAGICSLLSKTNANPKVAKNGKLGILTAVLHLAPGDMSGHEVCPKRSPGCSAACLHYAGSPAYLTGKTTARIARTKLFFSDRNLFMNILVLEMAEHIKKAQALNLEPAFRLNATSDIVWEKQNFIVWPETIANLADYRSLMNLAAKAVPYMFPTTSFYDYTAIPKRSPPSNYHLTFSAKEQNMNEVLTEMARGLNIAVVFPTKDLPGTLWGRSVIDGDDHDYRPADPQGVIVGLKAKGVKGRADTSGFIYRVIERAFEDNFELGNHGADPVRADQTMERSQCRTMAR